MWNNGHRQVLRTCEGGEFHNLASCAAQRSSRGEQVFLIKIARRAQMKRSLG